MEAPREVAGVPEACVKLFLDGLAAADVNANTAAASDSGDGCIETRAREVMAAIQTAALADGGGLDWGLKPYATKKRIIVPPSQQESS